MAFEAKDPKIRAYAVEEYMSGLRSQKSICNELGIGQSTLSKWVTAYNRKASAPIENKEGFIQELSELLQSYSERKFRYIEYTRSDSGIETVRICFEDEPDKEVNVTGKNCIAVMGIIAHILL